MINQLRIDKKGNLTTIKKPHLHLKRRFFAFLHIDFTNNRHTFCYILNMVYYVYIAKCADGTFYTGYTTDLTRREKEHNSTKKAAKYTKGRNPVKIIYSEKFLSKSVAMKREHIIKKLPKNEKLKLFQKGS